MKRVCFSFLTIFLFSCMIACGGSGNGGSPVNASLTSITPAEATVYASQRTSVSCTVSSKETNDSVLLSLYLISKDEYDGNGNDLSSIETMALLGTELISVTEGQDSSYTMTAVVPDSLAAGNYYIGGFVNEYEKDADDIFVSPSVVVVSIDQANTTNLRITKFVLDESSIIVGSSGSADSSVTSETSDAVEVAAILGLDSDTTTALTAGSVSDAEIKGYIEVTCDGPLPSGTAELNFQFTYCGTVLGDDSGEIEYWDSSTNSYKDSMTISFMSGTSTVCDEGSEADYDENRKVAVADIHINIPESVIASTCSSASILLSGADGYAVYDLGDYDISVSSSGKELGLPETTADKTVSLYSITGSSADEDENSDSKTLGSSSTIGNGWTSGDTYRYFEPSWSKYAGHKDKFKAGIDTEFELKILNNSDVGTSIKADISVPVWLVDKKFKAIEAYFYASSFSSGSVSKFSYNVDFLGTSISNAALYGNNIDLPLSKAFNKEKELVSYKFWVGPIPFKVALSISGIINLSLNMGNSGKSLYVKDCNLPEIDFGIVADGGPSIDVLDAGICCDFVLIQNSLICNAASSYTLNADGSMATATASAGVTDDLEMIKGKFGLYVKYYNWRFQKKTARLWLYNTDALFDGTYTIADTSKSFEF